jgi:tetratricopeptide (TPR) repeat protein
MTSPKFTMNLLFAALVAILALTALWAMFFHTGSIDHHPVASIDTPPTVSPTTESAINRQTELERLTAAHPENAEYQNQLANFFYDEGQYGKALDHYQLSLKIRPQDPSVETDLATCYHYLGQNNIALELLNKVIKSNPDFSPAKFNKGIVLINGMKDIKNGISVWKELLASDPDYSQREELTQRIRQLEKSVSP